MEPLAVNSNLSMMLYRWIGTFLTSMSKKRAAAAVIAEGLHIKEEEPDLHDSKRRSVRVAQQLMSPIVKKDPSKHPPVAKALNAEVKCEETITIQKPPLQESPYPNLLRPSFDECFRVKDALTALHGAPQR